MIAGYFGSGAQGHPNQGYELLPPYGQGSYVNENFPGSVQTQVTGLNNRGVTVGFWSTMNTASMTNNNFGFVSVGGRFYNVNFPTGDNASPPVDQLLGVNDSDVAVGFYTDGQGNNHGYEYNVNTHRFTRVTDPTLPGASLTAAAINDEGDVAHAAHIHDGSCMSQGPVQYMLMDFMANSQGQIVNQTRTVTGVTSAIPATGLYLNLHQGNSNNILANGAPTINFRPLLCAGI